VKQLNFSIVGLFLCMSGLVYGQSGVVFVDRMESLDHWKGNDLVQLTLDKTNRKTGYASLRVNYTVDKSDPGSAFFVRTDVGLDRVPSKWEFFAATTKDVRFPYNPKFRMAIQDKDGTVVIADVDGKIRQAAMLGDLYRVEVAKEEFVPLWPGKNGTLDGVETISFELIGRGGEFLYEGIFELYMDELSAVFDNADAYLGQWAAKVGERTAALKKELDGLNIKGSSLKYPQATLEVITMFQGYARDEYNEGKRVRAARQLEYLDQLCDELHKQIAEAKAGAKPWPDVPEVDHRRLSSKSGDFCFGEEPVYITGCCGWWGQDQFPSYSRLGFNGISMETGASATLPEENKRTVPENILGIIKAAGESNLAVDLLLSPHYIPEWAYTKFSNLDPNELRRKRNSFMPWNIDSPDLKFILSEHVKTLIPAIRDFGNLISYDVTNEMWFAMLGDFSADDFRAWLKDQYGTIVALNTQWATDFKDFSEAECPIQSPGAVKDRYRFQEHRLNRFYRWFVDEIHKSDAKRPIYGKIHGGWRHVLGVDRRGLSRILTASGADCYPRMNNPLDKLVIDAWDTAFITQEFRSLAPDKPIVDSEHHIIFYNQIVTPEYIRAVTWWRAILGLDASYVWVWGRGLENEAECIFTQPWAVHALGQTGLDLQRSGRTISLFQRFKPDVMLVDSGYRTMDAYKLCSYSGVAFDVIPPDGVTAEHMKAYRTIVVPPEAKLGQSFNEILAKAETGGAKVIRLSERCELCELSGKIASRVKPAVEPKHGVVNYTVLDPANKPVTFLLNLNPEPVEIAAAKKTTLGPLGLTILSSP